MGGKHRAVTRGKAAGVLAPSNVLDSGDNLGAVARRTGQNHRGPAAPGGGAERLSVAKRVRSSGGEPAWPGGAPPNGRPVRLPMVADPSSGAAAKRPEGLIVAKRKYRFTEAKKAKFEEAGRGRGHGPDYRPWLTIHDVSSHGRSHRIRGAKAGRVHHLLSDIELAVFLECDWHPGVVDIREQFPLDRNETKPIAAEMRVRHPQDRGVDVVMTTDLLVDYERGGVRGQVAIAVKPASQFRNARVAEKLEIERRYWARRAVSWRLVTDKQTSRIRTLNLAWLHEARWLDHLDMPDPQHWRRRCAALASALPHFGGCSVREFNSRLEGALGWEAGAALFAIRHMVANRVI